MRKDASVAVIPSVARPTGGAWYEGSDLKALAEAAGIIEACFYEPGAARVKADLFDVKRRLRGRGRHSRHHAAGMARSFDQGRVPVRDRRLEAGGVTDLAFYNWGHLRQANLAWIGEAMAMLGEAP